MKMHQIRPLREWLIALFEGVMRFTVGCITVGIVIVVAIAFIGTHPMNPFRGRLPSVGPRVPIPNVPAATIRAGRIVYNREGCSSCHTLLDPAPNDGTAINKDSGTVPDLTHEGRRNASIAWQISNLKDHDRVFPGGAMSRYDDLSPGDLKALASLMATRR